MLQRGFTESGAFQCIQRSSYFSIEWQSCLLQKRYFNFQKCPNIISPRPNEIKINIEDMTRESPPYSVNFRITICDFWDII